MKNSQNIKKDTNKNILNGSKEDNDNIDLTEIYNFDNKRKNNHKTKRKIIKTDDMRINNDNNINNINNDDNFFNINNTSRIKKLDEEEEEKEEGEEEVEEYNEEESQENKNEIILESKKKEENELSFDNTKNEENRDEAIKDILKREDEYRTLVSMITSSEENTKSGFYNNTKTGRIMEKVSKRKDAPSSTFQGGINKYTQVRQFLLKDGNTLQKEEISDYFDIAEEPNEQDKEHFNKALLQEKELNTVCDIFIPELLSMCGENCAPKINYDNNEYIYKLPYSLSDFKYFLIDQKTGKFREKKIKPKNKKSNTHIPNPKLYDNYFKNRIKACYDIYAHFPTTNFSLPFRTNTKDIAYGYEIGKNNEITSCNNTREEYIFDEDHKSFFKDERNLEVLAKHLCHIFLLGMFDRKSENVVVEIKQKQKTQEDKLTTVMDFDLIEIDFDNLYARGAIFNTKEPLEAFINSRKGEAWNEDKKNLPRFRYETIKNKIGQLVDRYLNLELHFQKIGIEKKWKEVFQRVINRYVLSHNQIVNLIQRSARQFKYLNKDLDKEAFIENIQLLIASWQSYANTNAKTNKEYESITLIKPIHLALNEMKQNLKEFTPEYIKHIVNEAIKTQDIVLTMHKKNQQLQNENKQLLQSVKQLNDYKMKLINENKKLKEPLQQQQKNKYKEELEELKDTLLKKQEGLQQQLNDERAKNQQISQELIGKDNTIREILAENEKLNKEIQEYRSKETNKKQQSEEFGVQTLQYESNQKVVEENKKLKKANKEYETQNIQNVKKIKELEENVENLKTQIATHNNTIKQKKTENTVLLKDFDKLNLLLNNKEKELHEANKCLNQYKVTSETNDKLRNDYMQQIKNAKTEKENLQKENKTNLEKIQNLEEKLKELNVVKTLATKKEHENNEYKTKLEETEQIIDNLSKQVNTLTNNNKKPRLFDDKDMKTVNVNNYQIKTKTQEKKQTFAVSKQNNLTYNKIKQNKELKIANKNSFQYKPNKNMIDKINKLTKDNEAYAETITKQTNDMSRQKHEYEQQIDKQTKELENKKKENDAIKTENNKNQLLINTLETKIKNLNTQIQQKQMEMSKQNIEEKKLSDNIQQLQLENDNCIKRLQRQQQQSDKNLKKIEQLKMQLIELNMRHQELQNAYDVNYEQRRQAQQNNNQQQLIQQIQQLNKENSEIYNNIEALTNIIERKNEQILKQHNKINSIKNSNKQNEEQLKQQFLNQQKLIEYLKNTKEKLKKINQEISAENEHIDRVYKENYKMHKRKDNIIKNQATEIKNLTKENNNADPNARNRNSAQRTNHNNNIPQNRDANNKIINRKMSARNIAKNTNSNTHNIYSDIHDEVNNILSYNNSINNETSLKNTIYSSNQMINNNTNRQNPKINNYLNQQRQDINRNLNKKTRNNHIYPIRNNYQSYFNANNNMENNDMINYDGLRSNTKNMNYMYKDIYRNGQNEFTQLSAKYKGNGRNKNNLTNKNYIPYRQSSQYQDPINYM